MSNCYVLLNHNLTDKQTNELQRIYHVSNIVLPGKELTAAWKQAPLVSELQPKHFKSFVNWLSKAVEGDLFVIQGEAGLTFALVDYALARGLIPLHAVTKRTANETKDGEKVTRELIFEHICFREYKCFRFNPQNRIECYSSSRNLWESDSTPTERDKTE